MKNGKKITAWLLAFAICFSTLLQPAYVKAAAYDDVTVDYIYRYISSDGQVKGEKSMGGSYTFTVDQSMNTQVRFSAPQPPAGYHFTDVTIASQNSNGDGYSYFSYAQLTGANNNTIILGFNGRDSGDGSFHRNVRLRLICTATQYQVTYDYNGGHGNKSGKSVYYDEPYGTLPQAEKSGTTFRGWSLDIGGNKIVDENTLVTTAGNHVLYAQWGYNSYRVSFDANGGECGTSSEEIAYGTKYKLPSAVRDGFAFAGWYTAPNGGSLVTSDTVMNRAENHTLYAHWTNNSFNVSFDANGGIAGKDSKQVTYLGTYGTLPDAAKAGFRFIGWFTQREGGDEVIASSTVNVSKPHTLFAHWSAVSYQATYDANGGTCDKNAKTVFYGEPYGSLAVPQRQGATFKGWSLDIDGNTMIDEATSVKTASNHKLYAQWSNNGYEITLDANGGECAVSQMTIIYGKKYGTLPTATREGFTFIGWFTKQDGGLEITSKTTMDRAENHTLYAHWKNNSYDVVFDGNGGVVNGTKKQVTYLGTYGTLPTATRTGYTFAGWHTSKSEGSEITASSQVDIPRTHTLYAHWTPNTYTILFNTNGGECEMDKKDVVYASAYGELPIATRTGYTFAGWYLKDELITEKSVVYITDETTLVAGWIANHYEIAFDPGDGNCDTKYKEVVYDECYGELPVATKTGYTFMGWYLKDELITAESAVAITKDEDLIAKYSPNYYTVTFNANGGECDAQSWQYLYDDYYYEFPTAIKEGYIFQGWFSAKEGGSEYLEDMRVKILEDITIYAHWKKVEPIPEDDWYTYPSTPDLGEEPHAMTIEEAAEKYGYTKGKIRSIMNIYQVVPGVAGNILANAEKLGSSYRLVTMGLESIENKKSGNDMTDSDYLMFMARIKKSTDDTLTIKWKKVKGASSYIIYASECGNTNKFTYQTTTKKRTFTKRKLKAGTYYRFIVVACATIDGKQVPIAISKNVHGVTSGGEYGNVKAITVKSSKKTLKSGKKYHLKAKQDYGDKKHDTHRKLSYVSSNKKVATVSKKGVVKAKSKGTCYIYCYDQSGFYKKVKIKVKK